MTLRRHLLGGGLASAAALAAPALRAGPQPLVVWFTVEGAKAMRRVGEAFTAETREAWAALYSHVAETMLRGAMHAGAMAEA